MRKNKANKELRHNSTLTWQEKTKNNNYKRIVKFRSSLVSTKNTQSEGNIYEGVLLPELDDDDYEEYENMNAEEQRLEEINWNNEWVAENLVDFFHDLSMIYNIMVMNNTDWQDLMRAPEKLPNNGFPPDVKYLWKLSADEPPQEVTVEDYIQYVLDWIERQVLNEDIFPTDGEVGFKINFIKRHAHKIFQRMFRILAIMLVNPALSGVNVRDDENTRHLMKLFRRFMCFAWYWELVAEKETNCIFDIIKPLKDRYETARRKFEARQARMDI